MLIAGFMSGIYSQNVGINRNQLPPHPSALLDLNDNASGLLIPRLTQSARDSILNPADALLIFNTSSRCFEAYDSSQMHWHTLFCYCPIPPAPAAPVITGQTAQTTEISWTPVPGAMFYELELSYDALFQQPVPGYQSINAGFQTQYVINGVSCDSVFYVRVRARLTCGPTSWSASARMQAPPCPYCMKVGGNGDEFTTARVVSLPDQSLIMAGTTASFGAGNNDFYVLRLNPDKSIRWSRTIGGSGNEIAFRGGMCITTDGHIVVAGYTDQIGTGGQNDLYIVKLDTAGQIHWTKTIGGSGMETNYGAVAAFPSGGVIVGSRTNTWGQGSYDKLLVRLDAAGNIVWTRVLGGSGGDYVYGLDVGPDSTIVAVGMSTSSGNSSQGFISKWNHNGQLLWSQVYGGTSTEYFESVAVDKDNNIYVTGYSNSYGAGNLDALALKISENGNLIWAKVIGGNQTDNLEGVYPTSDGNLICIGTTESYGAGSRDIWVIKLKASNGDFQSAITIGSSGYEDGFGMPGVYAYESGYVMLARTDFQTLGASDFFLVQFDNQLNSCCGSFVQPAVISAGSLSPGVTQVININPSVSSGGQIGSGGSTLPVCP